MLCKTSSGNVTKENTQAVKLKLARIASIWPQLHSNMRITQRRHVGGVNKETAAMQIPPFVSLCKHGFWSHERTHSITDSFLAL